MLTAIICLVVSQSKQPGLEQLIGADYATVSSKLGQGKLLRSFSTLGLGNQEFTFAGSHTVVFFEGKAGEFSTHLPPASASQKAPPISPLNALKKTGWPVSGARELGVSATLSGAIKVVTTRFLLASLGSDTLVEVIERKSKPPSGIRVRVVPTLSRIALPAVATRKAILDTVRDYLMVKFNGQSLKFEVHSIRHFGTHAFLMARPVNGSGGDPDYRNSTYREHFESGAFEKQVVAVVKLSGKVPTVVELSIGATDVVWLDWPTRLKLPVGLFFDFEPGKG